tara:strand:- start:131 stop:640 length:510 start_codon:yes stop_codon:yes gene_type:complete
MDPLKRSITNRQLLPLLEVIELFMKFDKEMPAQMMSTYLYVATHNRCHKQALEEDLKFSSASGSRNTDYLSPTHRLKKKGFSLLEKKYDQFNRRRLTLELTPDGKKLGEELEAILYSPEEKEGVDSFSTKFIKEKEIKSEKEKDINSLLEKYKDIDPELLRKALRGSKK